MWFSDVYIDQYSTPHLSYWVLSTRKHAFGSSSHQCTVDSFIFTEAGSFPIFSPLGGTIYIIFLDIAFTDQKKVYPEIKLL